MFEDGAEPISEEVECPEMAQQEKEANAQNQDAGEKQRVNIAVKGVISLQKEEKAE